jgi:hypothetical protein
MRLGLSSMVVTHQFLPIVVCCKLYNRAPLLSWLYMQSDSSRWQTFLHHIGQECIIGSSSTFVLLATAC